VNGFTVIAAAPGYDMVAVHRRRGTLYAVPVIGWSVRQQENGVAEAVRPILPRPMAYDPNVAYAIRWPDGRVHDLESDAFYRSMDEWTFDTRRVATGHEMGGTA
jgi:hypothetical protein